jgi:hypothetical protein
MKPFFTIVLLTMTFYSFGQTSKQTISKNKLDSLKVVLEEMVDKDQNIRRILIDSIGWDSPNAEPYRNRMMEIDSENQEKLSLILDNYGWIEQSKIGLKASEAFFYVIQHSNQSLIIKWFPEFKRLANIGEANKVSCAMMEDRLLMWQGKKQIYGSQANIFREDKQLAIWPIQDPKNVNKRRMKIGFELTVEKNAERLKAVYNVNEKLPKKSKK